MTFEEAITAAILAEMEHIKDATVSGQLDIRLNDRQVGGYHALRLVIEEFIPDVHKKLNER
jgi:hypothetical protein